MAARNRILESRRKSLDILSAAKLNTVSTSERITGNVSSSYNPNFDQPNGGFHKTENKTNETFNNVTTNGQISDQQLNTKKMREPSFCQKMLSWRGAMVLLLHASVIVNVLPRHNLSIAIVCMVNRQTSPDDESNSTTNETHSNTTSLEVKGYEFDWDSEILGLLLTGVQFVSFLGPLVANFLKDKIGGKFSLTLFSITVVVFSMLTPLAARTVPYILLAIRVVSGVISGTTAPVIGEAIAWWSPDSEKLTWVAVSYAGFHIGGVLCSLMSGYLCSITLDNGWPFIFYLSGVLNLIWLVAWQFLYVDKPEDHPYISEDEKNYIIANRIGMTHSSEKKMKAPVKKILTSVPVLAYVFTSTCHIWTMTLTFVYLPQYISGTLKFSAQKTGIIASVISISRFLGAFLWTGLGNWLITRPSMSKSKARKMCILVGLASAAVVNILLCFLDEEYKIINVAILMMMMLLQAVGLTALTVLPLDMAPMFAGMITSINFSFGMLVSISGPLLVANIASNNTFEEWRIVWMLTTLTYASAGLVFGFFGQATLQPWAEGKKEAVPNIVLPFVSMGRRFSAIYENLPVSPLGQTKRFDFSLNAQLAFMLPVMAETPNGMQITDKLKLNLDMSPSIRLTRPDFLNASTQISWRDEGKCGLDNEGFQAEAVTKLFVLNTTNDGIRGDIHEKNINDYCETLIPETGENLDENCEGSDASSHSDRDTDLIEVPVAKNGEEISNSLETGVNDRVEVTQSDLEETSKCSSISN
ncbi:hypothetical protein Btru_033177 [Bulinus truncatus]|nr:hypothetical protein Btru_033177 [Bulinus truncatus]